MIFFNISINCKYCIVKLNSGLYIYIYKHCLLKGTFRTSTGVLHNDQKSTSAWEFCKFFSNLIIVREPLKTFLYTV